MVAADVGGVGVGDDAQRWADAAVEGVTAGGIQQDRLEQVLDFCDVVVGVPAAERLGEADDGRVRRSDSATT